MEGASLPFPTAGLPSSADLPHHPFPTRDVFPTYSAVPTLFAAAADREGEQHQGQVSSEITSVTTSL